MIYRKIIGIAAIVAFLMMLCSATTEGFQDVLDSPAELNTHIDKVLFNGITRFGNNIICVGQHGIIIYSDDRGKNWTQGSVPVSSDLTAVHFTSSKKGWAVGHNGVVLHTSDGGATWIKQLDGRSAAKIMTEYYATNPPKCLPGEDAEVAHLLEDVKRFVQEGPDKPFLDVWFENETAGFIVGAFNLIFRTSDGGKSWEPWFDRTENRKLLHMYSIRPIGKDLFIVGEQGLILKLDKRMGRFQKIKTPYGGSFFGIIGKPGVIIAFGMRGKVLRSIDGGTSWQIIESGVAGGLTGATLTEEGRIFIVSQDGSVIVSTDEGATFETMKVKNPFPLASVETVDQNTLVLVGFNGVQLRSIKTGEN